MRDLTKCSCGCGENLSSLFFTIQDLNINLNDSCIKRFNLKKCNACTKVIHSTEILESEDVIVCSEQCLYDYVIPKNFILKHKRDLYELLTYDLCSYFELSEKFDNRCKKYATYNLKNSKIIVRDFQDNLFYLETVLGSFFVKGNNITKLYIVD